MDFSIFHGLSSECKIQADPFSSLSAMDLARNTHLIPDSANLSPPSYSENHFHTSSSGNGFPIIAVAVIGISATAFLLVCYYIFVNRCCLNWHHTDLLRRLNLSRSQTEPFTAYFPARESHGLDESVIRSIPVFQYKKIREMEGKTSFSECPVCLNEFEEDEKLKIIPNCSHFFHIDCIDIWLENNPNCPLCRTSISKATHFPTIAPSSSHQDPIPFSPTHFDQTEDFIVIEVANSDSSGQENPTSGGRSITPSPRMFGFLSKSRKKLSKVTSMGDECIDIREKDEQFSMIQPIRRSFSMDSSADRELYLAIQEGLQKNREAIVEDGSSRIRRSFFSFGHGHGHCRGSKNAVLPLPLDP